MKFGVWEIVGDWCLGLQPQGFSKQRALKGALPGPQKVCKTMAFMATIKGLGLVFYILSGFW